MSLYFFTFFINCKVDSINSLINLGFLTNRTGSEKIRIGLIDGPVMINHPLLSNKNIVEIGINPHTNCIKTDSMACSHGTFIAGILKAKKKLGAPALCPDCTLLIRPVFNENQISQDSSIPYTNPKNLSKAIIDCVNANVNIINLSLALTNPSVNPEYELDNAFHYAAKRNVLIIAAAGNQGKVGSTAITRHPWVIPVIACNNHGQFLQFSNLGNSIGRRGLTAPGENIESLGTLNNNTIRFSGTSVAAPFVTGIIALLWSEFPELSASEIKRAINILNTGKSLIPPIVNAMSSYKYLYSIHHKKATA